MGLLANGFRDAIGTCKFHGAGTVNGGYPSTLHANFHRTGPMRNLTAGQAITDETVGVPYGYRHPGAWIMPQKPGALSSHYEINGAGDLAGSIAGGLNAEADLTGSGTMTGAGALIVSLVAALTGSGTISSATAQAFLNLAADLAGSGDIAGALTALAHAEAGLTGSGTIAGVPSALGVMAADITVTGVTLTTANVGASVWNAIAASFNDAGTMGEKMNDAGSASNPWTEVLESGFTAAQILRLIAAAVQGNATGLETGAPTFKGLDGTTDRITSTYSSGTRVVTDRDAD